MKRVLSNYQEIISISLLLVLSMAATTVMEFTDRVFLANYSIDAIAAAMPAGIAAFLVLTVFTGVAAYLNVFIAQYTGAGDHHRIGSCVWQGVYFTLIASCCLIGISFFSTAIFKLGGHPPEIQALENIYFKMLCIGGGFNVLGTGLAGFFTGRGKTRPVMVINIIGMAINIPLDYALINGIWIFPEMGIQGAGLATVCSWMLIALLYILLIFTPANDSAFKIWSNRQFDPVLFRRIIRKGGPAAMQFAMDVMAFTFFIFLVGRLGKMELAVSNIVFSIQSITFMPAIGFSMGLSTLVGQSLGKDDVHSAVRFTRQTILILLTYTLILDVLFIFFPQTILSIFIAAENTGGSQLMMQQMGQTAIRIMAVFICFDALYFTFLGTLRGAGDTRFIMWSIGLSSLIIMMIPLTLIVHYTDWGLFACWINLTIYVLSLFSITLFRYTQGKWKNIRVI